MEHVRWSVRPPLRRPVLIAAFEGWNDAGDAASMAARWFQERWAIEPLADIDPEVFFDFTTTRPQIHLEDGTTRRIEWPSTQLTHGGGAGRDVIVLLGPEPQLRWRTYCEQILRVARELDVELLLTFGALLAEVAHTRPTSVTGSTVDPELSVRLGLQGSSYEGPTGIVGVLHDACTRAGVPSASLWAAVPAYVPGAPSPKAALALVQRAAELLSLQVVTTDLEIASAAYERQVSDVVGDDEEMIDYVARLEARYENHDEAVLSPTSLVEEVERFLRDQRD